MLGAHYDHLGVVGGVLIPVPTTTRPAPPSSSPRPGVRRRRPLDRTLVFALFGAEEIGLVGSGHYVRRPAVRSIAPWPC